MFTIDYAISAVLLLALVFVLLLVPSPMQDLLATSVGFGSVRWW